MASSYSLSIESAYRAHHSWLKQWLLSRLNCSETAADLAQDTFVKLLRNSKPIENIPAAKGYLRTVAERLYIDHWRRKSIEEAWLETLSHRQIDYACSEEEYAIIIETFMQIDAMLNSLPDNVAKAFSLSMIEGLTYRQIAAELEVSERTVKSYMARAMFECAQLEIQHQEAMSL